MNNIDTKPSSWYDGSVKVFPDQQKINIKHIYILPRYVMIVFPRINGHNLQTIDHMG